MKRCERELKSLRKLAGTFLNVEPRALLLEGRLAELAGRDGKPAFQRALERARSLAMPLDQARALIELDALAEAESLLRELGRDAQATALASTARAAA